MAGNRWACICAPGLKDDTGTVVDLVLATGDLFNDRDMVRNGDISAPNPVFTPSEWTITPVTLATDASPGTHNGSAPAPAGPRIADIVTDPNLIESLNHFEGRRKSPGDGAW